MIEAGTGKRQRPRASHGALPALGIEAVPVGPIGLQSGNLDMDGMIEPFRCCHRPTGDDAVHPLIGRHCPADGMFTGDAAPTVRGKRRRRESGPDHKTVWRRIAGRYPLSKGIDTLAERPGGQDAGRDQPASARFENGSAACA